MGSWYFRNAGFLLAAWTLLVVAVSFLGSFLVTNSVEQVIVYSRVNLGLFLVQMILAISALVHGVYRWRTPNSRDASH